MLNTVTERYDAFLNQKNVLTDVLTVLEEKTGVQKQYIATGMCIILTLRLTISFHYLARRQVCHKRCALSGVINS